MISPVNRAFWADPIEFTQVVLSLGVLAIFGYQIVSGQVLNETLKDMALFVLSYYFGKTVALNTPKRGAP